MKTLNIIQTISKIAKIVSKVIFVFCIVGGALSAVGIVSLAFGVQSMQLAGVTLQGILQTEADMTAGSLYAALAESIILCAGGAVLAKFAVHYFERELADGTPFTLGGAKELLRLGILSVCIPISTQVTAQIVQSILKAVLTDVTPTEFDTGSSVAVGALLIVLSLVCKYGAELIAEKTVSEAE